MGHAQRGTNPDHPVHTFQRLWGRTMIHSTSIQRSLAVLLLAAPLAALAVGPGSGSQSRHNFRVGNCQVSNMQVLYKLDSLMGEPTVSGSYKWSGNGNCSLPSSTTIWLKVEDGSGGRGYVRLSPAVPKGNAGYGYNPTGSPRLGRSTLRLRRQPPHQLPAAQRRQKSLEKRPRHRLQRDLVNTRPTRADLRPPRTARAVPT